ncbi:uncharacterized protein [Antedon mediterranea]|uniref:uncharacterized protein n=1 Tax=Antedon mediterranea TaxID=105859 RepID=UPI003AF6A3ED
MPLCDKTADWCNIQNDEELQKIRSFKRCRCGNGPDKNVCLKQFEEEFILQRRAEMCELSNVERKMFIMGHISRSINRGQTTNCTKRKAQKQRTRTSCTYKVDGFKVCRQAFEFLHCISNCQLTAICKHFKENGVTPPRKNSGGRNKTALSHSDVKHVVTFLETYAERNGYALPGKTMGVRCDDSRMRLLPTCKTKKAIFKVYEQQMIEVNRRRTMAGHIPLRFARKSSFYKMWKEYCPYIKITKPKSDLCWVCQKNNSAVFHSANSSDQSKRERLANQLDHLDKVSKERAFYRSNVLDAKANLKGETLGIHAPSSRKMKSHYSFDFAQQVLYPSDPDQPGPIYFITQRKCGIFGVAAEGLGKQVNYLIDEGSQASKGANSVISYLHHFFATYGLGETECQLNCDNCSGQNKNNYLLWYLSWRCMHNLHASLALHFMIAGHTKFSPDWAFGLLKQRYFRCFVSSLTDMEDVVHTSSTTGVNIPQLVANEGGKVFVKAYDWNSFLSPYFRKLPNILKMHHIRFSSENPGMVYYKEYIDTPEQSLQLLKNVNNIPPLILPEPIPYPGLSLKRQSYLYDSVREFCKFEARDIVCPAPSE